MEIRSRNVILLVVAVVVIIAVFVVVIVQRGRGVQEEEVASEKYVEADISVLAYPSIIEDTCQRITVNVEFTNTSDVPLMYSDITNNDYYFAILVEDVLAWSSKEYMRVSDFEVIEPGETAELTFTGGKDVGYLDSSYHDNMFSGMGDNGTYDMSVLFNQSLSEDRFSVRGESEKMKITLDIYEDPSQNLLKSCE